MHLATAVGLVQFFGKQEVTDIHVLDIVSAHIELTEGDHIFWEIISDSVIGTEFTQNGFF